MMLQQPDANARLLHAAEVGNSLAMSQALAEGANPRHADAQQLNTALHQAAKLGDVRAVELLLAARADPNATNAVQATPLVYAAQKGHHDAVKALLASGARRDILTRVQPRARASG